MHTPLPLHLSVQANVSKANVKPRSGGRSQKMNKIFEKYGM